MERFSVKSISFVYGGINLTAIQLQVCMEIMPISMTIRKLVNHKKVKVHQETLEMHLME